MSNEEQLPKYYNVAPEAKLPDNAKTGDVCFITPPCVVKTDKGWMGMQIEGEEPEPLHASDTEFAPDAYKPMPYNPLTHVAIKKPAWRKFSEEHPKVEIPNPRVDMIDYYSVGIYIRRPARPGIVYATYTEHGMLWILESNTVPRHNWEWTYASELDLTPLLP